MALVVKSYVGNTAYTYVADIIKAFEIADNHPRLSFWDCVHEHFAFRKNVLAMANLGEHEKLWHMAKRLKCEIYENGVISPKVGRSATLYEYPSRTILIELGYSPEVTDLTKLD